MKLFSFIFIYALFYLYMYRLKDIYSVIWMYAIYFVFKFFSFGPGKVSQFGSCIFLHASITLLLELFAGTTKYPRLILCFPVPGLKPVTSLRSNFLGDWHIETKIWWWVFSLLLRCHRPFQGQSCIIYVCMHAHIYYSFCVQSFEYVLG